jgi:hypothetical protein
VLLGIGAGVFGSQTAYATGTNPSSVAIVDVNGDGKLDVVVTNQGSNSVSVLAGNGAGGLGTKADITAGVGSGPTWVAIADVNGDGKSDLVVTNSVANNVSVLLGNGAGAFAAATGSPFATGTYPACVAVGDVNGDGKSDLVVANANAGTVSVLLGNGDGTFQAQSTLATGTTPVSVAIRDVNGDGMPDLVVANLGSATVSVFLGNGAGGFGAKTDFATGSQPYSVAVADLNGDGRQDLVAASRGGNSVSVLLALGQTAASLAVAPDTTFQSRSFTLTSNVSRMGAGSGTPTGTVSFFDDYTLIGSAPVVGGRASLTLPAPYQGLRSFTAAYSGDGTFFGALAQPQPGLVYAASLAGVPPAAPLAFALEPPAPNPSRSGAARVSFTLPTAAHATLEVVDVSGRRIVTRDVGALGAGRHTVDLAANRAIAPGLYWVRLAQGGRQLVRRVAIVE